MEHLCNLRKHFLKTLFIKEDWILNWNPILINLKYFDLNL